jgi:hypothetical protein
MKVFPLCPFESFVVEHFFSIVICVDLWQNTGCPKLNPTVPMQS